MIVLAQVAHDESEFIQVRPFQLARVRFVEVGLEVLVFPAMFAERIAPIAERATFRFVVIVVSRVDHRCLSELSSCSRGVFPDLCSLERRERPCLQWTSHTKRALPALVEQLFVSGLP